MDGLDQNRIRKYLSADVELSCYGITDSTNIRAKEAAADGAPHLSFFVSEMQSAGRGRLGRSFFSPNGTGLYMTGLFRVNKNAHINLATIYAGVAVSRAIEKLTKLDTKLKWVNDIFVSGKKVCGILAEAVSGKDGIEAVVIGIGVNVNTPQGGFPKDIADIAGALDAGVERAQLCAAIIDELIKFENLDFYPDALSYYRRRNLLMGMEVDYTFLGEDRTGKVVGIDDVGALLIESKSGQIDALSYGEATIGSKNISKKL